MENTRYSAFCFLVLLLWGCASSNTARRPFYDSEKGYYTSAFPSRDVTPQLATIQRSVLRITSTSIYTTYFLEDSNVTFEELAQIDIDEVASSESTVDNSKAGTAISILQNNNHTVLVTAAHVLAAPDTLVSFKRGPDIPENKYLYSVSLKLKQRNFVHTYNDLREINILAMNSVYDLALLEIANDDEAFIAAPLQIKTGTAKNLRMGSFIYVMGFPLGSAMVTRGIVSAPNYDNQGSFLSDALFNHGISGGLILASRDNFESLEWVGMAITAAATEQDFLVPNPNRQEQYVHMQSYTDTAFVAQKSIINYGVTQALPIEKMLPFLYINEDKLNSLGLSSTEISGQKKN